MNASTPGGDLVFRPMTPADYDAAIALWRRAEMMGLGPGDDREGVERFLARNPGASHVALGGGALIGTLLAGHDGRRGWLHHMAVDAAWRRRGVARRLAESCLARLAEEGMTRVHLMIFNENKPGQAFWQRLGWERFGDAVCLMGIHLAPGGERSS